jgi:hypothetical protein
MLKCFWPSVNTSLPGSGSVHNFTDFVPDPEVSSSVSDPDPHSICLLDPDPAADKISFKRPKNSYHLELFD